MTERKPEFWAGAGGGDGGGQGINFSVERTRTIMIVPCLQPGPLLFLKDKGGTRFFNMMDLENKRENSPNPQTKQT